jgi:hypothetical protein
LGDWIFSLAFGVGHNPDPFSLVRGIDGASWYNDRPDLVAETFQISTHLVECQVDDARHILAKEPSGPESVKAADHFRPEVTVICRASSLPGNTERLAGESSADKVHSWDVSPVDFRDVVVARDCRPVLFEDFSGVVIVFNLPFDSHSGSFKAKVKSSYSRKETPNRHKLPRRQHGYLVSSASRANTDQRKSPISNMT